MTQWPAARVWTLSTRFSLWAVAWRGLHSVPTLGEVRMVELGLA